MGKDIKKPVTNGVAKTPLVMQLEALECGAASLTMIMAYYGKWVQLEQVRVDCGVSRNGSNAKNILRAAQKYGFKTKGFVYNVKKLREKGVFASVPASATTASFLGKRKFLAYPSDTSTI